MYNPCERESVIPDFLTCEHAKHKTDSSLLCGKMQDTVFRGTLESETTQGLDRNISFGASFQTSKRLSVAEQTQHTC